MLALQRKTLNAARLLKLNPAMRRKVAAIIADLEAHGYQPLIDAQVWRSPAQQAKLKAQGRSKVSYSFHNCTTRAGLPDSLAADITDARYGWESPKAFWLTLAAAAQAHGCTTGIYWGLSVDKRIKIRKAIARRDFNALVELGWDTAHVEPSGLTLDEAKAGKRPN